jgi:SH3-like domain-containing protein
MDCAPAPDKAGAGCWVGACCPAQLSVERTHAYPRFVSAAAALSVALGCLAIRIRRARPQTALLAVLRADEVNMRVGPGEDYGVRFVYHRKHLPVRVLRIKENWRLVEDPDGVRGWMVINFLSTSAARRCGARPAEMRSGGSENAGLLWKIAPGAVGKLGNCGNGWCQLNIDNHVGYVRQERLWGVGQP